MRAGWLVIPGFSWYKPTYDVRVICPPNFHSFPPFRSIFIHTPCQYLVGKRVFSPCDQEIPNQGITRGLLVQTYIQCHGSCPYTLKCKDNLQIDFVALTMIGPTSSWFEIAELPVVKQLRWQTVNSKELLIADKIFDKTLENIAKLVNKTWLCRYPRCRYLINDNGSELNYTSNTCVNHMVLSVSQPLLRIHKQMAYWNVYIKS